MNHRSSQTSDPRASSRSRPTLDCFLYLAIGISVAGMDSSDGSASEASSVPGTNVAGGMLERGPLRVHPTNRRYFTDDSGKAIYLTGSHNDANFMDAGTTDPPPVFDFVAGTAGFRGIR